MSDERDAKDAAGESSAPEATSADAGAPGATEPTTEAGEAAASDSSTTESTASEAGATEPTTTEAPKRAASLDAIDAMAGSSKADAKPKPKATPKAEEDDSLRSNIRTVLGALFVAILVRIVVFEAFQIEGPSMEPTFVNGDRVIVWKFPFGLSLPNFDEALTSWGMPHPGDVVIVHSPADNVDIVKRVIGVPGDRIEIRDDVVYRNGEPIRRRELGPCTEDLTTEDPGVCVWFEEGIGDRTWRTSTSLIETTDNLPEREVPPGRVFVMGDHRDRSNDSRNPAVGMIPISRVKGRAAFIYWSSDGEVRWDRFFMGVR